MDWSIHVGSRFLSSMTLEAAESLLRLMPDHYDKATFLSSGSEAVELAIGMARLYMGRSVLLSFGDAYLGAYGASANASGTASDEGCIRIPPIRCRDRDCDSCIHGEECGEALRAVERSAGLIACFVFEPILVSGGVIRPCSEMIRRLCRIVKNGGGLVVVDEVTTGFGRTGETFGYSHHGIEPDIIALGKALGNGFPVSAVVTRSHVEKICVDKGFYYVQSHQLDPFGCAIVKKVAGIFDTNGIIEASRPKARALGHFLNDNKKGFIKEIRCEGLAIAIEPRDHDGHAAGEYLDIIKNRLLDNGVIIGISRKHGVLRMLPPLTITDDEIGYFKKAYLKAIEGLE